MVPTLLSDSRTSRIWSRRWKSGSSPIETTICTSALLTDFRDACEETLPEDEPLLRLAQKRIEELNDKYSGRNAAAFSFFFIARAGGIARERLWMGYERKRGKLAELNSASARRLTGSLLTRRR